MNSNIRGLCLSSCTQGFCMPACSKTFLDFSFQDIWSLPAQDRQKQLKISVPMSGGCATARAHEVVPCMLAPKKFRF